MALIYDFVGKKPRVQVPGEYPVRRPLPGYHFVTSAFAGRLALGRLRHRTKENGHSLWLLPLRTVTARVCSSHTSSHSTRSLATPAFP